MSGAQSTILARAIKMTLEEMHIAAGRQLANGEINTIAENFIIECPSIRFQ